MVDVIIVESGGIGYVNVIIFVGKDEFKYVNN